MFSSIAQVRANLTQVDIVRMDDTTVTDRIALADDDIVTDLSKYVNFSLVPATGYLDSNFPAWLKRLSQFKSCSHILVKLYGAKRSVDQVSDIQYWDKEYADLLNKIKMNMVETILVDGTNITKGAFTVSVGRQNISPVLEAGNMVSLLVMLL